MARTNKKVEKNKTQHSKKHPSYKKMIIQTIKNLSFDDRYAKHSFHTIRNSVIDFYNLDINFLRRVKKHIKQAIDQLVENEGLLIRVFQDRFIYRFSAKFYKRKSKRKRVVRKKLPKIPKKLVIRKKAQKKIAKKESKKAVKANPKIKTTTVKYNKVETTKEIKNPFAKNLHYNTVYEEHIAESRKTKALWQYYDNNKATNKVRPDGWYDYESKANEVVEEEWQKYIKNRAMNDVRAVKSGEFQYFVDFINWQQTNIIHPNHTKRNIRRLDENGKVTVNPYESAF